MEIEERKQEEIEYYDKRAKDWLETNSEKKQAEDFEGFNPALLSSFLFCYQCLEKYCRGKKVLDYGCGNGVHSAFLAKAGAKEIIGVDLSQPSLEIARERAKQKGVDVNFLKMDCEALDFAGSSFDIILDGGTFSSIDMDKAFPELARVLKPDGFLIGIETFGHNPIANLKRKLNKVFGKRTGWAEAHIFKTKDLKEAEKYFNKVEAHYFHIISFLVFPLLHLPGGKLLLKLLEKIDRILFLLPFLRKYAFKTVFIFSKPKKHD
ncbi:class I SAM-dependent methyltransferase [Candidatus Parcubacteria bacterium]|nr:class I SAM-dependent methyltransferase [Candidatus Parcubacteria bacterium]